MSESFNEKDISRLFILAQIMVRTNETFDGYVNKLFKMNINSNLKDAVLVLKNISDNSPPNNSKSFPKKSRVDKIKELNNKLDIKHSTATESEKEAYRAIAWALELVDNYFKNK
jgi:hypothetical protein